MVGVTSASQLVRYYVAVVVLAAVVTAGSIVAAATEVNTDDGALIVVLLAVSTVTLIRLAQATGADRLRPIVPLAFLPGLIASAAMFFSILRWAEGGSDSDSSWFLPITIAHLVTVIAYAVVLLLIYRREQPTAARWLFAIAYFGIVLTFCHVLFV